MPSWSRRCCSPEPVAAAGTPTARTRSPPSGTDRARSPRAGGLGVRHRQGRRRSRPTSACSWTPSPTWTPTADRARPAAVPHLRDAAAADRGVARRTCGTRSSTCTRWSSAGTTTATSSTRSATWSPPAAHRSAELVAARGRTDEEQLRGGARRAHPQTTSTSRQPALGDLTYERARRRQRSCC